MKSSFGQRVFLLLLPLWSASVFGQGYPQLICDSISASKSKCGFSNPCSVDGKVWLTRFGETQRDLSFVETESPTCHVYFELHDYASETDTYNPDSCLFEAGSCTGGGSQSLTADPTLCNDIYDCSGGYALCSGSPLPCGMVNNLTNPGFATPSSDCGSSVNSSSTLCETTTTLCSAYYQSGSKTWVNRLTFSNEYTTAMLISNTVGALPSYPGTFTGTCSAYRNLSSGETSYTIRRFRYKFTFLAATRPFIIRWVERFWPEDGGSPSDTFQSESISIGATQSSIREVLEPSSDGTVTIEYVCVDPSFDPNASVATPDATPSPAHQLQPNEYGATATENLYIGITACSDGTNWRAILTELDGHYSEQWRLLPGPPPQQGVTGPGGNTTEQNFCEQVKALNCLGLSSCLGYYPVWYMLQAVLAHENVHAAHMTPALQIVAPSIETAVEALSVPDSGQTVAEAVDQIRASGNFDDVMLAAFGAWSAKYGELGQNDENGDTQRAEHLVVDPKINEICQYANANAWQPPCPVCPTPTPPPAPTANAATNVTSTGFTANWSSVPSAASYRLDVSTSSSFTSYVSGYQDLNVGNVTSRSVSGLNRNTNYYYRVRAYNIGGTSGNSNVQNVKTKPH